jgi:hypothetical protein
VKYAAVLLMFVLMALPCQGQSAAEEARESLPPRRLSDVTKNELAACLKKEPGRFSIMSIADNEEAYRYAEDWLEVFAPRAGRSTVRIFPFKHSESLVACGMECEWECTMPRQLKGRRRC